MREDKSDLWNIIVLLKRVNIASFITIIIIVGCFVTYLILGDRTSSIDTVGVYNLVNSESGEVIATDLTPEDIDKIMEMLTDGKD